MVLIALGANLSSSAGAPIETLRASLTAISRSGIAPVAVSRAYRVPAWPDANDPPFVNAVAAVETTLAPDLLMAALLDVEDAFGRVRAAPNAPRTLDLDLIDYEGQVRTGPLVLPHPRAHARAFVLVPLAEIAPGWRHPGSGRTVDDLLDALARSEREAVVPLGRLWP